MRKWARFFYQPCLPLGEDGRRVTGQRAHIELSRKAAAEGMVLLKNEDGVLPFSFGKRVAVFGKACADYVKGGGGSGDVTVAYTRSLLDGLRAKEQEGKVKLLAELGDFYEENVRQQYAQGVQPGMTAEPEVPEALLSRAEKFTDTAIVTICRFSGEGWDRTIVNESGQKDNGMEHVPEDCDEILRRCMQVFERGDFYLSNAEQRMIETVQAHFAHVVAVLNVGGMVDTVWIKNSERIQGALLAWQGGIEGGMAAADILCGDVNPSGKLADTFAGKLTDYPSSANFHESENYVEYTEDIYVGYRYFETLAQEAVVYPFGFGLSYTDFEIAFQKAEESEDQISVDAIVTNVGAREGKEVVQLYVRAPQGRLGKPERELKAFAKTRLLKPGEMQLVRLTVKKSALASYDDSGKVEKNAWVLEAGTYCFHLGNSVRSAEEIPYQYICEADAVLEKTGSKCAPVLLHERMLADGSMETLETHPEQQPDLSYDAEALGPFAPGAQAQEPKLLWGGLQEEPVISLEDVYEKRATLEEFMAQLTDEELVRLLCGQPNTGVANTFGMGNLPKYGVPNVMTEDGPAGVRINRECGVCTTAFPCATLLACTWNEELAAQVGEAGAREAKENNIGIWLTPAMNIHRSPLCGRNFEYYSEDPLVAGKMGAAMVRGIQSQGIAASAKYFACNNKETNRKDSDSRVSERALREIYLKGFEIMVKESDPWTIMTSYNIINGHRASANRELLTGILRGEWGFRGMITTDWWNYAEQHEEIKAGNDVKMGCGFPERTMAALQRGELTREDVKACAKRVLEMIMKVG